MKSILAEQALAALVSAPAETARKAAARLEADDFEDWRHRTIFGALLKCSLADHPEPGSVMVQINGSLLADGHYRDQDNGLRTTVADLAGVIGHPEQLTGFVDELLEQRFRRAVTDYALAVADHASRSPLADVDAALARITELRRLRARIPNRTVQLVKESGVA